MKYIPTFVVTKFTDIDFDTLYAKGKRIILTDLDNTLINYHKSTPSKELILLNEKLHKMGFTIYIISNNSKKRINEFSKEFKIEGYLSNTMKPYSFKLNQFITKNKFVKEEIIFIGDQILTDIACANSAELDSLLVKSLTRSSEKWYTKINRLREKRIMKKIKEIDIQKYEEIERLRRNYE